MIDPSKIKLIASIVKTTDDGMLFTMLSNNNVIQEDLIGAMVSFGNLLIKEGFSNDEIKIWLDERMMKSEKRNIQ